MTGSIFSSRKNKRSWGPKITRINWSRIISTCYLVPAYSAAQNICVLQLLIHKSLRWSHLCRTVVLRAWSSDQHQGPLPEVCQQIILLPRRQTKSEILGVELSNLWFNKPSKLVWCMPNFEKLWQRRNNPCLKMQ